MSIIQLKLFNDEDFARRMRGLQKIDMRSLYADTVASMMRRSRANGEKKRKAVSPATPYRHGYLNRSRKTAVKESGGYFGYSAEYAPHVEYGHRLVRNGRQVGYVKGQHFLRANIKMEAKLFKKRIQKVYEEAMKGGK